MIDRLMFYHEYWPNNICRFTAMTVALTVSCKLPRESKKQDSLLLPITSPNIAMATCPSVCPSRACIVSRRLKMSNLSNGTTVNDLERPLTRISKSRHFSTLNISETTRDRTIVTIERQ